MDAPETRYAKAPDGTSIGYQVTGNGPVDLVYSGGDSSQPFDLIEQRNDEVQTLIGGVPGFISYTAARTTDGGITVTVCGDKTGTDESSKRAAAWVKENSPATVNPPTISEGNTVVHFHS